MDLDLPILFDQWLLDKGFVVSFRNDRTVEYVKPLENRDSLYVKLTIQNGVDRKVSINVDGPNWPSSDCLHIPRTAAQAQLLFWFHGHTI